MLVPLRSAAGSEELILSRCGMPLGVISDVSPRVAIFAIGRVGDQKTTFFNKKNGPSLAFLGHVLYFMAIFSTVSWYHRLVSFSVPSVYSAGS